MTAIFYIFIINWLKDWNIYISIYTMQQITQNKFNKCYAKYTANKIDKENIKNLYIEHTDNINPSFFYGLSSLETLIFDWIQDDKLKIDYLPYNLKNLVLNTHLDLKVFPKIPFGCKIHIFDPKKHFKEYHESIAFTNYLTKTLNLKVKDIKSCFSSQGKIFYCKMSLRNLTGVYSSEICEGKVLETNANDKYIYNVLNSKIYKIKIPEHN